MIIFGLSIAVLMINAKIQRICGDTINPDESYQTYSLNHFVMVTTPMNTSETDRARMGLVQSRVINVQDS